MSASSKTIGLIFIDRFADWEYGLLAASAVEWFGAKVIALTPNARPVASSAGLSLAAARGIDQEGNRDLDALAVIGSDRWVDGSAPDAAGLLVSVASRGGVIGGICAGTVPLAKAGLFADVAHTSNGPDWIREAVPGYAGAANYRDVPHAIADGNVVSAPGSAPGTFAHLFLRTLFPERRAQLDGMRAMFGKEYAEPQ